MMKTTFVTMLALGTWPLISTAMPTKAELDKVSPVVADLMRPEQEALKTGKKSKSEVAAAALELVAKADGEAAKLLLTKGAYNLYVRDGDFDKAIATLKSFREIVPDMEPQYLANIIESSLRTISRKNGGQLYQLLDETRTIARYRSALKKLEAQAKNAPTDKSLQLKLAEHYAVLNDWTKALDAFALSSDRKASDVAKMEKADAKALKVAADFWWNYPVRKAPEFEKPFRQHAAKLYEQAIASGELVGLNKVQADRRIEEANALGEAAYAPPMAKDDLYCVIDLSGGPNAKRYPVSYLNAVPKGGWTDEYKTTKLVLRKIEPASFEYLPGKCFKVTTSFYIGVFEVTQKQYQLVTGKNPSQFKGDLHPVEQVSFRDLRGIKNGDGWPENDKVDDNTFLGLLRKRAGIHVDLPTEVQWECACRAGTSGNYNVDGVEATRLGKCRDNGGRDDHHVNVGSFLPNGWGLYDMHGNVLEWCLDRERNGHGYWSWSAAAKEADTDPRGWATGSSRIIRGGCWFDDATTCRSSLRHRFESDAAWSRFGLRLAIQSPFVPQKVTDGSVQSSDASLAEAKREMEAKIAAQHEDKLYCVIDLSGGPNAKRYPVSYLNAVPKGGWTDEYKTRKLVMRKIQPTGFRRGDDPTQSALYAKDFYIGVFEVTQRQWELVKGDRPSFFKNEACYATRPVEMVTYMQIRGNKDGMRWPLSNGVDVDSFIGILREKTGLLIDLPIDEQWTCAYRAGRAKGHDLAGLADGRARENGGWVASWGEYSFQSARQKIDRFVAADNGTAKVGSYVPNGFGLYDMDGNVDEICNGRIWGRACQDADSLLGSVDAKEFMRIGGSYLSCVEKCGGKSRQATSTDYPLSSMGLRIVIQPGFIPHSVPAKRTVSQR